MIEILEALNATRGVSEVKQCGSNSITFMVDGIQAQVAKMFDGSLGWKESPRIGYRRTNSKPCKSLDGLKQSIRRKRAKHIKKVAESKAYHKMIVDSNSRDLQAMRDLTGDSMTDCDSEYGDSWAIGHDSDGYSISAANLTLAQAANIRAVLKGV